MDTATARDPSDLSLRATIEELDEKCGLSSKGVDLAVLRLGSLHLPEGDLWAAAGRIFGIAFASADIETDREKARAAAYSVWTHAQNWAPDAVFGLFGPFHENDEQVYVLLGRGSPAD